MRWWGWFFRVWYSFAIAFSVAASTWGSTRNISFWVRVGIMTAAFFAALVSGFAFQGEGIQRTFDKKALQASVKQKVKVKIETKKTEVEEKIGDNNNKAEASNDKAEGLPTNNELQQKCCTKNSTASISSQLFFSLTYGGSSFVGRFYLFTRLCGLVGLSLSAPVLGTLGLTLLAKLFFDFTNEGYETNEMIANSFKGEKPFYAKFFRPLSHEVTTELISKLGSADHAVFEDLLPWLGYLPKNAVSYLAENPIILGVVITIGSAVGGGLAVLIYAQTYYYEGNHTEENLRKLRGIAEQLEKKPNELPTVVAKVLDKFPNIMNSMAGLHGVAGAMPVFLIAQELLVGSSAKWAVDALATLFVLLGIVFGVYYSEVTEAKEEMSKRMPPKNTTSDEEKPLINHAEKQPRVHINSDLEENLSMTYATNFKS